MILHNNQARAIEEHSKLPVHGGAIPRLELDQIHEKIAQKIDLKFEAQGAKNEARFGGIESQLSSIKDTQREILRRLKD